MVVSLRDVRAAVNALGLSYHQVWGVCTGRGSHSRDAATCPAWRSVDSVDSIPESGASLPQGFGFSQQSECIVRSHEVVTPTACLIWM